MNYTVLNINWNADPNAPEPKLQVEGDKIIIDFWLNYFIYPQFTENDRGRLTFYHCHKYDFNGTNDEGYYLGQHRYNYEQLPWGEFYKIETNWETDFPKNETILSESVDKTRLSHYIFFFRDQCFECVAEGYELEFIKT